MVNAVYASCSIMMRIPTDEPYDLPSPLLVFFQTSSQEVLQMEPITEKFQEVFSRKKLNVTIMPVGDTILDDPAEDGIDKILCLLGNK